MESNELYVAEYSAKQDAFNTDTLEHVLQINRQNVLLRKSMDYMIIAICDSASKADDVCRQFRSSQNKVIRNQSYMI